jgi:predicted DNA-binding transcriptional regulator AlpA
MEKDLLKASEVAALLHISQRTVWKWSALGILPSPFRLGRVVRWRGREVERILKTRPGRPTPHRSA